MRDATGGGGTGMKRMVHVAAPNVHNHQMPGAARNNDAGYPGIVCLYSRPLNYLLTHSL